MTRVPLKPLTVTREPLELLTLTRVYLSTRNPISRLISDAFRTIASLSKRIISLTGIRNTLIIYACCVTRIELLVGQAGKSSACVMDIIWEELKRNNIDIDKDMLSFYISKCLDEHEELYGAIIIQIDGDNLPNSLCDIYAEMAPNNFGRIMAYLTLVYKFADSLDEETTREAVRRTVEEFKRIDLAKYQVKSSPNNENQTLLGYLVKSLIFAYLHV